MTYAPISRVYDAFATIPPMRPDTLLPLVIMLMLWIGLTASGLSEGLVFVLVIVLAQTHAVWRSLPQAVRHMQPATRFRIVWVVILMLKLATLQLYIADPLFSQRLLSGGCIFVLMVMLIGVRREKEVLDRVTRNVTEGRPISLLRVNAGFALAFLCLNEALIATGSLTVWMTVMMLAAFVVHAAYWFTVLLVIPEAETAA